MDLFTTILCTVPIFVAVYVLGEYRGREKGYTEGFREGSEKGITNTTKCLTRALKAAGYKDKWISGLFDAMKKHINPVE